MLAHPVSATESVSNAKILAMGGMYVSSPGSLVWTRPRYSLQEVVYPQIYPKYAKRNEFDASDLSFCKSLCCTSFCASLEKCTSSCLQLNTVKPRGFPPPP